MTLKIFLGFLFITLAYFDGFSQPANDDCVDAVELCVGQIISGSTLGATIEQCIPINANGCADDNIPCFVPAGSVWYKFLTNSAGGNVDVNFTNLFINNTNPNAGNSLSAVIVQSTNPCEGGNYTEVSNCEINGMGAFALNSLPLLPNTTYYIQVNGTAAGPGITEPAEVFFDISISGLGVNISPVKVNISATTTQFCQGENHAIDISLTNCNGISEFEWFYNGVSIYNGADFTTDILSEPGYLYLSVICGSENCPHTDESDSIFYDITPIFVDAGPDKLIQLGGSTLIDGDGVGDPVWTPSTTLNNPNILTPIANPEITTTYFLTVTNGACSVIDEMTVEVASDVIIPSAFTPNDDGVNDFFEVVYINQYVDNQVIIYDRSGQIVFKTTGYSNDWDGTYKDKPLPSSTYFYFIDLRTGDENDIYKGSISIVR